jgi:hypothetical protein
MTGDSAVVAPSYHHDLARTRTAAGENRLDAYASMHNT